MKKAQKDSTYVALTKTYEKLTKTKFDWDTTDLEKEVFNNGK